MGSSSPPIKKLDSLLPSPPKENLVSHFILEEIVDHIGLIQDDFRDVDIKLFREHLWQIKNKNVEPLLHLRGFLKVFEKTKVFQDAFAELDNGIKIQLSTFMAGGGEGIVLAAGGKGNTFQIPPSPAVKHHFKELVQKAEEKVEEMLDHENHMNGGNRTNGFAIRQVQKVQEKVEKMQEKVEKVQEKVEKVQEKVENVQEKVEKLHEKVEKILHHEDHSHVVNEDATTGDVDNFAIKEAINGHVEKAKDDLKKFFRHEKQSSADSAIFIQSPVVEEHAVIEHAVDDLAVKEITNGNTVDGIVTNGRLEESVSSTDEFPRIYEDQAETKTMEVSSQFSIMSNQSHIVPMERLFANAGSSLEAFLTSLQVLWSASMSA
jgi:gas vesicle protein